MAFIQSSDLCHIYSFRSIYSGSCGIYSMRFIQWSQHYLMIYWFHGIYPVIFATFIISQYYLVTLQQLLVWQHLFSGFAITIDLAAFIQW